MCFDLLHFAGLNLRGAPYSDRRRYLAQCLLPGAHLQLVHAADDAEQLYAAALERGFEGIIGKRLDSPYQPGQRSRAWLKFKTQHSEEFLVGGYTRGNGAREPLGALLLGYCDGKALRYAGHVGSGLDDAVIGTLLKRGAQLKRATSPFAEKPPLHRPTTWLKPELVAEVSSSEWTPAGALRAPVFVRLRDDVAPDSVRRDGRARRCAPRASVLRARHRRRVRQEPATKSRWCSSSSRAPPSAWSSGSERHVSASPTSTASTGRPPPHASRPPPSATSCATSRASAASCCRTSSTGR